MSAKETALRAHRALLNGSGELSYFKSRGIKAETLGAARIGYEAEVFFPEKKGPGYKGPAFIYPSIAKDGGLLGNHYKSKDRNDAGKRRQKWGGYASDLPPKGCGKKPGDPAKVIPFGMETLEDLKPGVTVVLCCGEEDALSVRQARYVALSQPGAGLLEPVYARAFAGLEVVVFYDAGEEAQARKDAATLLGAGAAAVREAGWPDDAPNGADVNGRLVENPEGFEGWLSGMVEDAKPLSSAQAPKATDRKGRPDRYAPKEGTGPEEGEAGGRKPTQAEELDRCAAGAELFHAPAGDAYATVAVGDHRETHPIRSRGFRRWLVRNYFERCARPPSAQALQDALGLLEARAQFDGAEREVHIRVAKHGGAIYVDLANEDWEAVEISAGGWRVIPSEAAPVRFRRPRGMLPLPMPARGGSIEGLRRFVNVGGDDPAGWRLLVAWLVQALRPVGPYPVLILQGEQGSAKSTAERLLRFLVDPSTAPLRTAPRNEHDLVIAANNSWCVAFDNISKLPPWCSDALCRLSTGGGFSARELFTDAEEVLFDATRPVILNGITDIATRPDLLDRALVVTLPPIPEEDRTSEAELLRNFDRERSAILGALFDAVSGALGAVDDVRLERLPRMADFALWATAAEGALGWEPGAFLRAYSGNRGEAAEIALDADPVAAAVLSLMEKRDGWRGTAGELLKTLNGLADEDTRRSIAWPGAANALSGRLKRLAPALRGVGIEYRDDRQPGTGKRVKGLEKTAEKDRHDRPNRHVRGGPRGPRPRRSPRHSFQRSPHHRHVPTPRFAALLAEGDGLAGRDDDLRPYSTARRLLMGRIEWCGR